jgi:1-acyl-sn-glycerol-3-phosphate acyltransferase
VPIVRDALVRLGGMWGGKENALCALQRGELVVCYPGGAREVLKHDVSQRYRLQWERSRGFARVAIQAGVPVIPFAAAGVDDTYAPVARLRGTGRLLMGDDKYDLPLLRGGFGPLPTPMPFWFRIGRPIVPSEIRAEGDHALEHAIDLLHRRVWARTQALLDRLVAEFRAERHDPVATGISLLGNPLACAS